MGIGVLRRRTAMLLSIVFICWGCSGQHSKINVNPPEETELGITEVLTELAKTPVPDGVNGEIYQTIKAELAAQLQLLPPERFASGPPLGTSNRVTDLAVSQAAGGMWALSWSYRNTGDYDQNGEVNIADLTPIGVNFGLTSADAGWPAASLADGDGNGEINIADVTPIGQYFTNECAAYLVETAPAQDGVFAELTSVPMASAVGGAALQLSFDVSLTEGEWVRVTPVDGTGAAGEPGLPIEVINWEDEFTFDIAAWQPDAIYFDASQLGLLTDFDPELGTFSFDAVDLATAGISPEVGDVLLVHGTGLGRVTGFSTQGSDLVCETEYAGLTDAILDGTVGWDYGVDFDPAHISSALLNGKHPMEVSEEPLHFEFETGNYKYSLDFTLAGQRAYAKMGVKRDIGGTISGEFNLEGQLERFRNKDTIEITEGQVKQFDHRYEKLVGDLTLELIVTGGTGAQDEMELITLPWVLLRYFFMAGPVPVMLELEVRFIATLVVPIEGSSWVKVKFDYDSDLGLTYNGATVGAAGRLGDYAFNTEREPATGAASAITAQAGFGFPRVSLKIFGDTLVPYAQLSFLIEGNFTPVFPVLQEANVIYSGDLGFKLDVLGLFGTDGSMNLFRVEENIYSAGETE